MAVTFTKDATVVTIQNPVRNNRENSERFQSQARTAAGTLVVYDKGASRATLEMQFEELRDSEKDDLQGFFEDTVVAGLNTFTLTDWEGNDWTACQFLDPTLQFTETADQEKTGEGAQTSFTSGGTTYPTTRREKGVWSVTLHVEATPPS